MARKIADRRTALENAARTKALVIAYLNAHPTAHTVLQLQDGLAEPLAAMNASHSLSQTLARMAKNGLIDQSKQNENDINSRCLYSASGSTFEPASQNNGKRKYQRIVHPDATKQLAVQLVGEGLSFAVVGRRLGVLAKNVARWTREAKANPVAQIAAADTVQLGRIVQHDNGLERENAELRVLLAKLLAELPVDRLARVLA